jgi:hypothetical protein
LCAGTVVILQLRTRVPDRDRNERAT